MKSSNLVTLAAIAAILPAGALAADHSQGMIEATTHADDHATAQVSVTQPSSDNDHAEAGQAIGTQHDADTSEPSNQTVEPQHFELQGSVTATNATSLTAAGQTIHLTSNTHVQGTLAIGATVHVEGTSSNGALTANEINVMPVQSTAELKDEFHLNGSSNSDSQSESTAANATLTSAAVPATVSAEATTHEQATSQAGVTMHAVANAQHELTAIFQRISSFLANLFHA